jgi:hypothetical protein
MILALFLTALAFSVAQAQDRPPPWPTFEKYAPQIGEPFPHITIHDDPGNPVNLRELANENYKVLVLGCLTLPHFLADVPGPETVKLDYQPTGMEFFYLYKPLANLEHENCISPFTVRERPMHITEAKRRLSYSITWLADTMENDYHALAGQTPNSEPVIDPHGIVVARRAWRDPDALRTTSPASIDTLLIPGHCCR